jgi:hypothetical protein
MIDLAEKYAPGLVDLAHQLLPFEHTVHSFTAGPQKVEADKGRQEYLVVEVPDIYFPTNQIYVTITRATCCVVEENGESYEMTFQGLLDYLAQLPRPLHYFAR